MSHKENEMDNIRQVLSDLTVQLSNLEEVRAELTDLRYAAVTFARQSDMTWADINKCCQTKNIQVSWERWQR